MWYCKMFFSEDREVFEYDTSGVQGYPAEQLELPFLESLLSFVELELDELTPTLRLISDDWDRFFESSDRELSTDVMVQLGALSNRHIYFKLLYLDWFDYHARMASREDIGSQEDRRRADELRQLPEQLAQYQDEIMNFFVRVLDVDTAGREPQRQASAYYLHNAPRDPSMFTFRPIPVSFEPVEPGRCSPVLYSSSIADIIDYSLRSCVEREITVRRCIRCGRYFPQTVRVSAEYCARPVADGAHICREVSSFQQWTKRQEEDPVFKTYRREYKRRFAWIRAERISAEEFSAWSVQARQKKKECDRGEITLEEYSRWLKES